MDKARIREIIQKLLKEVEEEDIGISLLTTFQNSEDELSYFSEEDRQKVVKVLRSLSKDSARHRIILEDLVASLMEKLNG